MRIHLPRETIIQRMHYYGKELFLIEGTTSPDSVKESPFVFGCPVCVLDF